jgi:protein-S-isoprenylcysteine O-methyltransferase Ste14
MSVHHFVLLALWIAWIAYWAISARSVKETARSETYLSRLDYTLLLVAGAILMAVPSLPWGLLEGRFVPESFAVATIGVALLAVGLAFSVWARVHLGGNWSARVTIKRDHALIRSGPYALVRHPIYTGLLVALAGTALLVGEWRAVVGWAFFALSFFVKLRREEAWMGEAFGADYAAYRSEVAAIIPFVL